MNTQKGALIKLKRRDNIMVCVTQQKTCERLIKKGAALKLNIKGNLYVIHVAKEGTTVNLGNSKNGNGSALEYLFNISKGVGADLTVLWADDITKAIENFVKDKSIGFIILGESPNDGDNGVIADLKRDLPECELYIMPSEEN